jgi:uncharacterized membrane protein
VSPRAYDRLRIGLSVAGLGIAGYLTLLHYNSDIPLVCAGGSFIDCATVLNSPSAVVFGIPVAVWGLAWFGVAMALSVLFLRCPAGAAPPALRAAGLGWALAGAVGVLWLVYQELGVVGRLCAWCTAVHVAVLAILVVEVEQAELARRGVPPRR